MNIKSNSRKKISTNVESEVMFMSNLQCCIDSKRGMHIHHIDENPQNNELDNLVLLCFECHDRASIKGGLSKKLSAKTIIKFRDHHYKVIETERNKSLDLVTKKITNPSYEDFVNASIIGSILVEISKIKREYNIFILMDRNEILEKLLTFTDYNVPRISFEIFAFLEKVAYETRAGLPLNMIYTIVRIVERYFPPHQKTLNQKQIEETGKLAINICRTIIYDTSIHSHKFRSMMYGYSLLKYIYLKSTEVGNKFLVSQVKLTLSEMASHLKRPERNDLEMATLMLKIYTDDIIKKSYHYPDFNDDLRKLIDKEK